MNTSNNVVSLQDVKVAGAKRAIVDSMVNRGANWVSEPFLISIVMDKTPEGVTVKSLLDGMVQDGTIDKTFHTASDKMNRTIQLPLYRLAPKF